MIQGIPESTPYVNMSCPRDIDKVTSHECVGKNYIQTRGTATTSTDAWGGMCNNSLKSPCIDTPTHISASKYDRVNTCKDDCRSA